MKRVLILGIDGYIGWSLAIDLLRSGQYKVAGLDNYWRRQTTTSLTPILSKQARMEVLHASDNYIQDAASFSLGSMQTRYLVDFLTAVKPDTIVHLAEQPSAPYSMKGPEEAILTQHNNVIGTLNLLWAMKTACPDAHLIKLGSMGEYGTPDCDIPEGVVPKKCLEEEPLVDEYVIELGQYECPMSGLLFPRQPGSWYHLSKVHDTYNIEYACRAWGFTSTDIMQGVVYGLNIPDVADPSITRFDYDECFGTVINRFCLQTVCEHPLTVYGSGDQIRGFLPLRDSLACLRLAIDIPPAIKGTYRTLNQFAFIYSINELVAMISQACMDAGWNTPTVRYIPNPRTEANEHYYNPTHNTLFEMGYEPSDFESCLKILLYQLYKLRDKVDQSVFMPKIEWR